MPEPGPASACGASGGSAFAGWARRLAGLKGWPRALILIAFGGLAAAALPPVYAVPLLPVALTGLVWILSGARSRRRAFCDGWLFGMGYFTGGLYWVANALLVDAARWAWLIPFAVLCIPAILSLYVAAVCALVPPMRTMRGRVLVLGAGWSIAEWLRGQLFTGFPWNPLGSVWAFSDLAIQGASLFGVLGLGFVTIVACAAPAALAEFRAAAWRFPVACAALLAAVCAYGAVRLPSSPLANVPDVRLRIVQPNIPQQLKWKRELARRHLTKLRDLSLQPGGRPGVRPVTHVIWPETAVPFVPSVDEAGRRAIAAAAPSGGLLITGAIRTTLPGAHPFRIWNSLHAIDGAGAIVATYDKFHLVPFGEYMPLGEWLGLKKLTAGRTDFSAGPGPGTISLPGLPPVSPLICYEIIFAGRVVDRDNGGEGSRSPGANFPGWLLNVTNDAWFGDSAGPRQHLVAARFRAIEQGLPVIRAANTGISAAIDPYGRVLDSLPLGRDGVIDTPLPVALRTGIFYPVLGDMPLLLLCMAMIVFSYRNSGKPVAV